MQDQKRIIKLEVKKNYIIEVYETPPNVIKYVRKEVVDKEGFRNIVNLAIVRDGTSTKTVATSFWRPINKPSAKQQLKKYLKKYPKKVTFANEEVKQKFLGESNKYFKRSVLEYMGIFNE